MDWTVGLDPWTGLMDCLGTFEVYSGGRCKTWTMDYGLDCWTGLMDWTNGLD